MYNIQLLSASPTPPILSPSLGNSQFPASVTAISPIALSLHAMAWGPGCVVVDGYSLRRR